MYASFFGLKSAPFSIAPDPHYLFMSERHREALAHLLYGVGGGGGFVLLTGDIGAGKTTVCRCFLEQIPRRCNVAYIFNPKLTVTELLQSVCTEFGIPLPSDTAAPLTVKALVDPLNEYLLRTHAVGQNNVLIIDEAQNLSMEVLEQLRLLTNLETSERKLLQIMLIGQPELRALLGRPELEQLAQRVIAHYHLQALSAQETAQYIRHRLGVAGLHQGQLFEPAAIKRIYQLTQGVPRRINVLCDRALLGAYASDKPRVSRAIVEQAAREVFQGHNGTAEKGGTNGLPPSPLAHILQTVRGAWVRPWPVHNSVWWGLAAVGLCGMALAAWLYQRQHAPQGIAKMGGVTAMAAQRHAAPQASAPTNGARRIAAESLPLRSAAEVLQAAWRSEPAAWSQLAGLWGASLAGGNEPCLAALKAQLMCFKGSGGLPAVRQLARPVLLLLKDPDGREAQAMLLALDADTATLQMGDSRMRVSVGTLAGLWRGDFATLWRTPEGYRAKLLPGQTGPVVRWLAARLSQVDGQAAPAGAAFDRSLEARLQAFQLSRGLKPDGVAGATTLMLLNQATGVSEPRLDLNTPMPKAGHVVHP